MNSVLFEDASVHTDDSTKEFADDSIIFYGIIVLLDFSDPIKIF